MSYSNAPEVKEIANDLIDQHHSHLANAPIEYVFNAKRMMKKSREILGEVKLVSGLDCFLITRDLEEPHEKIFVMTISKVAWDLLVDRPDARRALIDHELCHLVCDDSALSIKTHDLEEFIEIVERYGPWKQDILNFLKAAKQAPKTLMLPFDLTIARENQEQAAADRDEQERNAEVDEEKAAAMGGVRVVKQRKRKHGDDEAEMSAASGE